MSRKLLLADDSITIQKVIGITFAHEDYELTVVDNGDTALQKALENRPDLVLADVFMPGKNGYELCAAIKGNPALAEVPVLLLSGTFEPFDEQKARDAGADSWISKPFESQTLIERVEQLLNRPAIKAVTQIAPVQPLSVAAASAPSMPAVAATPPMEAALSDAPAVTDEWAMESPQDQFEDEWDEDGWQDEVAPEPLAPIADPWQNLAEAPASDSSDDLSWENAPAAEAQPAAAEEEEDLWGAVSFGEEDLFGDFAAKPSPEEDLWGGEAAVEKPPVPAAVQSAPILRPPVEPPAPVVTPTPVLATSPMAAQSATADFTWDDDEEEEIIPLDDLEILEEEDLLDDGLPAASLSATDAMALKDPFDQIALDEDRGLALREEAVAEISLMEESAADPFAMDDLDDPWATDESAQIEVNPAIRELLGASLQEPDWSNEVRGGEVELEEEEDFLHRPAQVAVEAATAAPVSTEQVAAFLNEKDMAELVEKIAGTVIDRLAGSILERIAWEVVPDLAENLIKEEIQRIKEEVQ